MDTADIQGTFSSALNYLMKSIWGPPTPESEIEIEAELTLPNDTTRNVTDLGASTRNDFQIVPCHPQTPVVNIPRELELPVRIFNINAPFPPSYFTTLKGRVSIQEVLVCEQAPETGTTIIKTVKALVIEPRETDPETTRGDVLAIKAPDFDLEQVD